MSSYSNKPKALGKLPSSPLLRRVALGMALAITPAYPIQSVAGKGAEITRPNDVQTGFFNVDNPKNAQITGIRAVTKELGISFTTFIKSYQFKVEHVSGDQWKIIYWPKTEERSEQPADNQRTHTHERPDSKREVAAKPAAEPAEAGEGAEASEGTEEAAETEREKIIREIRVAVQARINFHRRMNGLTEVERDPLAEKAAQIHAEEMLKDGVVSHWGADGRLAYHRFSAVGGTDAIRENCGGSWWEGDGADALKTNLQKLIEGALRNHDEMYNEEPPHDGHKRNILGPKHTGVGIGFAFAPNGTHFMAQEFTDHYAAIEPVKRTAKIGETVTVKGSLLSSTKFMSVEVYWEPFPKPMSKKEREQTNGYSLPKNRIQLLPELKGRAKYKDGGKGTVEVNPNQEDFEAPIEFDRGPGIYTVSVWATHPQLGNIQTSLISIDVTK